MPLDFEAESPLEYFSDFEFVQDVIYFEGPLLTHYVDSHARNYFFHWLDVDHDYNRWVVYEVSEGLAEQIIENFEIPSDPLTYTQSELIILDMNSESEIKHVYLYTKDNFPTEYR